MNVILIILLTIFTIIFIFSLILNIRFSIKKIKNFFKISKLNLHKKVEIRIVNRKNTKIRFKRSIKILAEMMYKPKSMLNIMLTINEQFP
ncbi:hypothetical protein AusDCA_2530 [Desulfitobacterium sp. AusDCA]